MGKVKKAQLGIRMMPPIKEKSPAGKNVIRFQKNPFTKNTIIKEKDVERKSKEGPRKVYKSVEVDSPQGKTLKMKRQLKENGKIVKRQTLKSGGKAKKK